MNKPTQVKKRDGRIVTFDQSKITNAIYRAMKAAQEGDLDNHPLRASEKVVKELTKKNLPGYIPNIEEIQDLIEETLIIMNFSKTAKAYILYRQERAKLREEKKFISKRVKKLVEESKKYFRNPFGEFIYYRTYSRWIEEENRRETWVETVQRYIDFMKENLGNKLKDNEYQEIKEAILKQEAMPSMRLMWSAGKAARVSNVTAYNCSYVTPTKLTVFGEIMYLLMCGTGVGFSVESQFVQKLPIIKHQTGKKLPILTIEDSKEGWANAITTAFKTWYGGKEIEFDFSKIRPRGSRLKTMGGRASGPEPLISLFNFAKKRILSNQGKRLSNLDVYDIICKIGELVVMGGVRRSALICLSDLDDEEIRTAKMGQFFINNPQRSLANNSAAYNEKPEAAQFLEEWLSLIKSGTGERGIFNREGLKYQMPSRRWKKFRKHWRSAGLNPCGEVNLRNAEFCNLTEVVARPEDTEESLLKKIRIATILGTYQTTLTNFPYISKEWKKNCNEERLLGVSITGQWDCPAVRNASTLKNLRDKAIEVNQEYAKRFGINPAAAVTSVKPSGNLSQLVDSSSGMHPRYAPFYIRRVRISASDPLFQMLKDQKYPYYPEVGQIEQSATTYIFEFPVQAPKESVFRRDLSAIDQLEYWKIVKKNYTEHNPSQTIIVGDDEWIDTASWLYKNWDIIGGLTFLPRDDYTYKMAPYEEISEEKYKELVSQLPKVDFSQIITYEKEDQTEGAKAPACESPICEEKLK
jgi:ribonucleoside-diphosphate reductase alpha chain